MNPENVAARQPLPIGSFEEAARFRLLVALRLTAAERLRDLEAMWDFNEMVEAQNPRTRQIAERLRARDVPQQWWRNSA
jgi:hypothetical protein